MTNYMLNRIVLKLARERIIKMDDEKYLKLMFKQIMKKELDLANPSTFNEKLQWLKLNDRNPQYTKMVDKYEVKKYVSNIIGNKYIIPTIGVYNSLNQIDFNKIPEEFVIKTTHYGGSEGVFLIKNDYKTHKREIEKKINKLMKKNLFYYGREWPYKNVKPRIIIEKYMQENEKEGALKDYKLFSFNGKVGTILVCSNRNGSSKNTDFYDVNWNLMPFTREMHKNNPNGIKKPAKLNEMVEIAEKLSANIPFVRVDLYEINGQVYFGELTFYPSSGFEGFIPKEYDKILGDMLELPKERLKNK